MQVNSHNQSILLELFRTQTEIPEETLANFATDNRRLDRVLIDEGIVPEITAMQLFAQELSLEFIDLKDFLVDESLLKTFPSQDLFRLKMLPLNQNEDCVRVAVCDPFDTAGLDELGALSGHYLQPVIACESHIFEHLRDNLGVGGGTVRELVAQSSDEINLLDPLNEAAGKLDSDSGDSSVGKLVNELLLEGIRQRASDIHIEPRANAIQVLYRVDGLLLPQPISPEMHRFGTAIISRLKILAHLNIAEKRLPQDGRIRLVVSRREIDVRVSIIPMLHGESVVLRLLDNSRSELDLSSIEFPEKIREWWQKLIKRPNGMILVTGPTGSGKTTTLYSSLASIKRPDIKIITIEDPVEYDLEGINQISIHSQIGLTFAAGLRSILRHDPDVVLIGEIRDTETAQSAVQASLTGHLVLSTLHTNDASATYPRLIDMGIKPYLVASTLEGVLAQRLVRQLCPACAIPVEPEWDALPHDFPADHCNQVYQPTGCEQCSHTGYQGRLGIFELLVSIPPIRKLCHGAGSAEQIRECAREAGFPSLRDSGWMRVISGQTSVDEVLRVCPPDENVHVF